MILVIKGPLALKRLLLYGTALLPKRRRSPSRLLLPVIPRDRDWSPLSDFLTDATLDTPGIISWLICRPLCCRRWCWFYVGITSLSIANSFSQVERFSSSSKSNLLSLIFQVWKRLSTTRLPINTTKVKGFNVKSVEIVKSKFRAKVRAKLRSRPDQFSYIAGRYRDTQA